MNRKRKEDESFGDYRASQNAEAASIKQTLQGKYLHVSKAFTAKGKLMMGQTRVGSFKDD
jgi:hypothetical protein